MVRAVTVIVAVAGMLIGSPVHATRYYVDPAATGLDNGLSWDDAFVDLGVALAAADSADTVWVAMATYKPHPTTRSISFTISSHVVVLGGFNGTETSESQRDPTVNVTTLSGEIGAGGTSDRGGFMFTIASSPTVVNGTIVANTSPVGGTISAVGGGTATIVNTIVWGNGLALEHTSSPHYVSHSLIEGSGGSGPGWNAVFGTDGGGNIDSDPLFVDLASRDLHLTNQSPAVDTGDDAANTFPYDADGNARITGVIDMGAYETSVVTAVHHVTVLGELHGYPNPFNPSVTLTFRLPSAGNANLVVTDVAGRLVRTLYRQRAEGPVRVTWEGTDESGSRVASGVYFVTLHAEGLSQTLKLVIIK